MVLYIDTVSSGSVPDRYCLFKKHAKAARTGKVDTVADFGIFLSCKFFQGTGTAFPGGGLRGVCHMEQLSVPCPVYQLL